MKAPTIFAQVRRGANPALNLPDNYRTPEKSGMKLFEPSSLLSRDDKPENPLLVDLSGIALSCRVTPTDKMIGEWREFVCPQFRDLTHTTRLVRVGPQGREAENRAWEHRVLILEKDWQRLLAKVQAIKNPQAQVVKPNASEKHFQPRRVQVAHYTVYSHYRFDAYHDRYAVIVRDMATCVALESLHKGEEWQPLNLANLLSVDEHSIPGESFTSKTTAFDAAKRAASERQLAFDPRLDLVEWKNIFLGPVQHCVACGNETNQRGNDAIVCPDCRTNLDLGKHARAQRVVVEIPLEGVLPWGCLPTYLRDDAGGRESRDEVEQRLLGELLGLCGATLDPDAPRQFDDPQFQLTPMGRGPSFSARRTARVLLSQEQFERLASAVETIGLLVSAAAIDGHANGSNLLRSLAFGKITAGEFDERVIESAQRMQGARASRSRKEDEE